MRTHLLATIAAIATATMGSAALATTQPVIQTGDQLDIAGYGTLSAPELRKVLNDAGYRSLGLSDHTGNIIKLSGVGPDGKLYRLRVHSKTGTVIEAYRIKYNF